MLGPLLFALAEKIEEMRGEDLSARTPPLAIASVVSGTMERLASFIRFCQASPALSRTRMIDAEFGRASCRERVGQTVLISVVAGRLHKHRSNTNILTYVI